MILYYYLTYALTWLVTVPAFILEVAAMVDAASRPAAAYVAHGKWNKLNWVAVLAIAALFGLTTVPFVPFNLGFGMYLGIFFTIPAGIYFADVMPAFTGRSSW